MYQPAHFRVDDAAAQHALIAAHPLATLVVPTETGVEINHVPLRHDAGRGLLLGHVSRATKLSQNRPAADHDGVVDGLQALGDDASAALTAARMLRR